MNTRQLLERINELEGVVENLRELAASAYIFCGVHDAPEPWLDAMFAASFGADFTTDGLLPYTPSAQAGEARSAAYDMIDRYLRNNLMDDDYAEYSEALETVYTPQPQGDASPEVSGGGDVGVKSLRQSDGSFWIKVGPFHGPRAQGQMMHAIAALSTPQARPVATVCQDNTIAIMATGVELDPGTKLYTHPAPQADVARLVASADCVDIANRTQEITGRGMNPSTVKAVLEAFTATQPEGATNEQE